MSATISMPDATSSARAAMQVVYREGDRGSGCGGGQETLVVAAGTIDLDQVAVPGFEVEDRPSVVPVSGLQAQDVAHEGRHRIEGVGLHAHEGQASDVHDGASWA